MTTASPLPSAFLGALIGPLREAAHQPRRRPPPPSPPRPCREDRRRWIFRPDRILSAWCAYWAANPRPDRGRSSRLPDRHAWPPARLRYPPAGWTPPPAECREAPGKG